MWVMVLCVTSANAGEMILEPKVTSGGKDAVMAVEGESGTGTDVYATAPFFAMTVLMSSGHLLTSSTLPGRLDGAFKLWGSQSVSPSIPLSIFALLIRRRGST